MSKTADKNKSFRPQIEEIFGKVEDYREDWVRRCLDFRADHNNVAYDQLRRLSKLLKTTKINFAGVVEVVSNCPTCGPDYENYCEVSASEVGAMK